jgi:hypothetical protein
MGFWPRVRHIIATEFCELIQGLSPTQTKNGASGVMQAITRRTFASGIALLPSLHFSAASAQAGVTPTEARAIAKEAYVYGFPLVDSYRIQYDYFVDSKGPEFKAPWNHIANTPRVYTPADTAIQNAP